MASIIPTLHVYLTAQEVKDSTSDTTLSSLSNSQIDDLICRAEQTIIAYLWCEIEKNLDMQLATFYTVGYIHKLNWDPQIKSETSWNRSVTYELWEATVNKFGIPDEAMKILKLYKWSFIKQVL